jgi:ubiquinone/menaquinone biosynthesis C-methylase UbiE
MAIRSVESQASYLLPYLQPGMRVLDIGCGPGTISVGLAAAVSPGEFCAIDLEESQVSQALEVARKAGLTASDFVVADALHLPFPDSHFDVVHCHAVLTHVPDTLTVLAEIRRVLRTGGIFGAREPITDAVFFEPDAGRLNEIRPMYSLLKLATGGHPYIGKELRAHLIEAGFRGVESRAAFESYGSDSGVSQYARIVSRSLLSSAVADQAVALGIATQEDFRQWREAVEVWSRLPGAFATSAWGETVGFKSDAAASRTSTSPAHNSGR